MSAFEKVISLKAGERIIVGDCRVEVSPELAESYTAGDKLLALPELGELLHIPDCEIQRVQECLHRAQKAFFALSQVPQDAVLRFYRTFADYLQDDSRWDIIASANSQDVADAKQKGRSVTRLTADKKLRHGMVEGLKAWSEIETKIGEVLHTVEHDTWKAQLVGAPLGIVGFVFEGRPNVLADATGVLRNGNVAVLRIGSDALATARALVEVALRPALLDAGLPSEAVTLIDSRAHAAAWALFSHPQVSLAVARGSGRSVRVLGEIAKRSGVPVSLHGTGGAWLFVSPDVSEKRIQEVVSSSLDRKVCNTLNTCVIFGDNVSQAVEAVVAGLQQAAKTRSTEFKLHVCKGSEEYIPQELLQRQVKIVRSEGAVVEMQVSTLATEQLGTEWEWEESPEMSIVVVSTLDEGVRLFNLYSPQFVACLLNREDEEFEHFYSSVNAPFVGDGFTRWVDGQYALCAPELGLSNWEHGRLLARPGVLSGSTIYTVRTRVRGMREKTPSR